MPGGLRHSRRRRRSCAHPGLTGPPLGAGQSDPGELLLGGDDARFVGQDLGLHRLSVDVAKGVLHVEGVGSERDQRGAVPFPEVVRSVSDPSALHRFRDGVGDASSGDVLTGGRGEPEALARVALCREVLVGEGVHRPPDGTSALGARDPELAALPVNVLSADSGDLGTAASSNRPPDEWLVEGKVLGRFWGYWLLDAVEVAVPVEKHRAVYAARVLRRWTRASKRTRREVIWRTNSKTGELYRRHVRRRVRRMRGHAGFVSVNDAPHLSQQLATAIERRFSTVPWVRKVPLLWGCLLLQ